MRRLAFIQEKQMIFSTYQFIFLFLPVTFFVYFLLNRFRYYSIAKIWLVLTSLYFYGQGSPDFLDVYKRQHGQWPLSSDRGRIR